MAIADSAFVSCIATDVGLVQRNLFHNMYKPQKIQRTTANVNETLFLITRRINQCVLEKSLSRYKPKFNLKAITCAIHVYTPLLNDNTDVNNNNHHHHNHHHHLYHHNHLRVSHFAPNGPGTDPGVGFRLSFVEKR